MKDDAFNRAWRHVLLDHCFFGSLMLYLKPKVDRKAKNGMWVDGKTIGYNPEDIKKLSTPETVGLLAKGVLQCALQHHIRRGNRDYRMWNEASDYVTSPLIIESGLKLPPGAKIDPRFKDKSVEQVYDVLWEGKNKQPNTPAPSPATGGNSATPQGAGPSGLPGPSASAQKAPQSLGSAQNVVDSQGPGQPAPQPANVATQALTGEVRDLPGASGGKTASPSEMANNEQNWKINLQQAINIAMSDEVGRGSLPGSFIATVEKSVAPTISWKNELRRFFQSIAKDEMTWARPNRRFMNQNILMPSAYGIRMGTMVVVNDTSGSTSRYQQAFLGEIQAIIEDIQPEKVYYIQQDSKIQKVEELEPGDEFEIGVLGHGGTDFRPVFEWIEKNGITPACMVFLTDLDGPFPKNEPDYPVLWAVAGGGMNVPFGEKIKVDLSQQ